MGKLSKSALVEKLARKTFGECDLDGTGNIDAKELHVGLLLVFDKLNKVLPVHMKPPKHSAVQALMKKYDADGTGHLTFDEFHQVVASQVGLHDNAKFTESIPFAVGSRMLFKMLIFPLAAYGLKQLLVALGGDKMDVVPNGVLAFGVEGVSKIAAVKLAT